MPFEHKPNRGSIFRNQYKEKENHPDHKGDCKIVCPSCGHTHDMDIGAWINELKNSSGKYFSLIFSQKMQKEPAKPLPQNVEDEDIPF